MSMNPSVQRSSGKHAAQAAAAPVRKAAAANEPDDAP